MIALKCALLVSQRSYGHFLKLADSILSRLTRYLTQRVMPCYTHKMAFVSWPWTLWRHFTTCIWTILSNRQSHCYATFRFNDALGIVLTARSFAVIIIIIIIIIIVVVVVSLTAMPHGLVHESEEKLRAHFLHTGTPSATGLIVLTARSFAVIIIIIIVVVRLTVVTATRRAGLSRHSRLSNVSRRTFSIHTFTTYVSGFRRISKS